MDVFDIKSDVLRTLFELNLKESDLLINKDSKSYYHPGRSGSICLKSDNKKILAYFGEIHPAIVTTLDFKEKNVFGFEVFLDNIPEPKNKIRNNKVKYKVSDYQKSERDFAFVIDKNYNANEIETLVKNVNPDIIKSVKTFDVFEGQNLPEGKKSLAINVILQSESKTLTESDLEHISNKIIETVKEKTGATIRS